MSDTKHLGVDALQRMARPWQIDDDRIRWIDYSDVPSFESYGFDWWPGSHSVSVLAQRNLPGEEEASRVPERGYRPGSEDTRHHLSHVGLGANLCMAVHASDLPPREPTIFTADSSGKGQGAILNQDGGRNSPENPAARGSVVMVYGTGEGQTAPPGVDGAIAAATLPKPKLPVSASIGGVEAEVQYAGAAPGLMAGVFQVNLKVPESIAPGSALPLQIRVGQNRVPPE